MIIKLLISKNVLRTEDDGEETVEVTENGVRIRQFIKTLKSFPENFEINTHTHFSGSVRVYVSGN
ncbi:unnamed protein product [Meloidogyne enterolobii]|uniref:Uncharacterized protein n=1 Tax=Meloidogyne enterolobii TaxID=390850 RepID=A0ACB0ZD88_MELEN